MHQQAAHKPLDNSAVRLALALCAAVVLRYAVFPAAELPFLRFSSVLQPVHSVDWFETSSATCAGYFGNGFTEGLDLVGGSLACRTNPATRSFFCRAVNLLLNPSDIKMTRGDEKLEDVMGRSESDELPAFGPRAARIVVAASASSNWTRVLPTEGLPPPFAMLSSKDAFKFKLLDAMRSVPSPSLAAAGCTFVVSAPVLLLTRMEYVNLFHTSTGEQTCFSRQRSVLSMVAAWTVVAAECSQQSLSDVLPHTQASVTGRLSRLFCRLVQRMAGLPHPRLRADDRVRSRRPRRPHARDAGPRGRRAARRIDAAPPRTRRLCRRPQRGPHG